jgi:hypothetical protein
MGLYEAKPEGLEALRRMIQDIRSQLADLGSPTGTAINSLVARVDAKLAELDATVTALVSAALGNYYTIAQTNSLVASPGAITPSTVTASGTGRFDAGLYSTDAYAFNMTGTRVSGWHQIDGHIGTASSSERFKTNIVDAQLIEKAELILDVQWVYYNYKAEIAKRDDPTSPEYVGPEYQVHQELGGVAERLHEAGLWEFVIYERDVVTETRYRDVEEVAVIRPRKLAATVTQEPYEVFVSDTLRLNEKGEPIPYGIHYDMLGMAAIAAAQYLYRLHKVQVARTDKLAERLAALDGQSEG